MQNEERRKQNTTSRRLEPLIDANKRRRIDFQRGGARRNAEERSARSGLSNCSRYEVPQAQPGDLIVPGGDPGRTATTLMG
jgi:hypothetical protein